MKPVRSIASVIIFSLIPLSLSAQEKSKIITLNGYVTTLQSAIFDSLSGPFIYQDILHNRLNFKGYISKNITIAAEFRNRLFTGDLARTGAAYSGMIGNDPGWVDMSWNIVDKNSFFLNTTLDRLWLDLNYGKLQIRIGRQRINWGQTFVWNPNDIFNAYSFFDIDYVERPGSDAVTIQYYPSFSSTLELAVKADHNNDITAAGLYRFNKWGYDIQFLAGCSNSTDLIAGTGWSGSIGSVSFRGEGSWFHPLESFKDTSGTVLITASIDKSLKDNSMFQVQIMYCNNPLKLNNLTSFYSGNLSAKELAYSRFSAFGQFTWAVTPLLNPGISAIWFPDLKGYFAGPSLDFSMAENVDFSLFWQHFDGVTGSTRSRINLAFLRVKYSF